MINLETNWSICIRDGKEFVRFDCKDLCLKDLRNDSVKSKIINYRAQYQPVLVGCSMKLRGITIVLTLYRVCSLKGPVDFLSRISRVVIS